MWYVMSENIVWFYFPHVTNAAMAIHNNRLSAHITLHCYYKKKGAEEDLQLATQR